MKQGYPSKFAVACIAIAASIVLSLAAVSPASAQKKVTGNSGSRLRASISVQGSLNQGDSTVYVYTGNATDSATEAYSYSIPSGALIPRGKSIFLRDAQGHNYLTYGFVRNTTTGVYDTSGRVTKTYDAAGDPVMSLSETRDVTTGVWTLYSRTTNVFNAVHELLKYTLERWRISGGVWDSTSQQVDEYNAQGLSTKYVRRQWSSTTHLLTTGDSILTSYDASGTIAIKDSSYRYSTVSKKFYPGSRNTYLQNGTTTTAFRDTRDTLANVWKPSSKDVFTHSSTGKLLTDTMFSWNSAASAWKLTGVMVSTALGRGQVDNYYNWNASTSSFDIYFRHSTDTNSYGQMLLDFYEDYVGGGVWETNFGYKDYYEIYGPTAVAPVAAASARLNMSPNPASGFIIANIQWDAPQDFTVIIIDMQGKIVDQIPGSGAKQSQTRIQVDELAAGTYILKVLGETGTSISRAFVVQH